MVTNAEEYEPLRTLYQLEFDTPHHQAIAAAAEKLLKPEVSEKVKQILELVHCSTLRDVAGWADEIKRRAAKPGDDEFTKEFIEKNGQTGEWHYVDLPLECTGYDPSIYGKFCKAPNVVEVSSACIRVLQGESLSNLAPVNALRLLVHFIGDLHQPLHVGCCYFEAHGSQVNLTGNPDKIIAEDLIKDKDRGGNALILPALSPTESARTNLHAYWDSGLGGEVKADDDKTTQAAQTILEHLRSIGTADEDRHQTPSDKLATLPQEWANSSLLSAREAYKSIQIVGLHPGSKTDPEHQAYDVEWEGGRAAYDQRCKPILMEQMSRGAKNLALLINELFSSQSDGTKKAGKRAR